MKLNELEVYQQITIQCHDNPDGDAIASGFALYEYFREKEKNVSFIYSGRNQIQKANLVLMIEHLNIPIQYKMQPSEIINGLLLTVDCQYGSGNVTLFQAEEVAIIDHHQIENKDIALSEIRSNLGSCSTLVWDMMKEQGYDFHDKIVIGTALYYGLFMDTNQFAEIYNPLDRDMKDEVCFNKSQITLFRNSNLSLQELEIAGLAMIRHIYNGDYKYAIIKSHPCDPNLLGLISDFLLQVDVIDVCIVYNETEDGVKFSVRSCSKEVNASEMAEYVAQNLGSGGGHLEKAGGFISKKKYIENYATLNSEAYFSERMNHYFDNIDIIYAKEYVIDIGMMNVYAKKKAVLGFVPLVDIAPVGEDITVRTLEKDIELEVDLEHYLMLGLKGEVYLIGQEVFREKYRITGERYSLDVEYVPTVRRKIESRRINLLEYAKACSDILDTRIYAKKIERAVKIFPIWDEEKYILGKVNDYLVADYEDRRNIYVIEEKVFHQFFNQV